MAEEIILKVGVEGTGQGETKIKSLKAQLKEMKNELLGLDQGSDRFKELSKQAGELTDRIGDVNDKVKALSSDTKKLDALVGVGSAIAGGFQAAQGAMALFGSNSKEVERAIQNIIAVQGVLNGVQQVGQFLTAKGIVQDALATAALSVKAGVLKVVTAAQWLWNAAISANPIGVIVIAVTALTVGIYKLAKGLKEGTITIEDINKVLWRMIMPLQLIVDLYNELTQTATDNQSILERNSAANTDNFNKRMAEIKAERDEQAKAHTERQEQFDRQIERYEAEGKSSYALRLSKLEDIKAEKEAILQSNKDIIQATVDRYTVEAQLRGKSLEEFLASIGIQYETQKAFLEESLKDQEEAIYDAETDIIALKTDSANKAAEIERQRLADEAAARKKAEEEEEARQRALIESQMELTRNRNQVLLEQEQARLDAEFDAMEAQIDAENALKDQLLEQDKARNAERQKLAQDFAKATIDLANTVFTITNALGKQDEESRLKRAKRQFEINKALSIADATISTINGVVNALSEKSILPAPFSTIARAVNAASVAAAGLANIAKIGAQKFDGGVASPVLGSGGDSSGGAGGSTTPQITPIQAGSTFLNAEPQKVFVLESDITGVQKKVSAIESEATF